jgi:ferritin-like metal-binding protein YciE
MRTPQGRRARPEREPAVGRRDPEEGPMGLFSRDIHNLDELFLHQLKDIYYAEHQILKALPTMIEKASSPQLREAFETHMRETEHQVERLDDVFRMQNCAPEGVACPAIDGIIEEAEDVSGETAGEDVQDAALIASAQTVEHYEISRYGTLIAWAEQLGKRDCARLLEENLAEEKSADKKLTALAEAQINKRAA